VIARSSKSSDRRSFETFGAVLDELVRASSEYFLSEACFGIDIGCARASDRDMAVLRRNAQRLACGFAALALVCVALLDILSFVIAARRHSAFSNGDVGASISVAGEYCASRLDNGGNRPAHPRHQRDCALCIVCDRDQTFDALALLASVIVVPAPPAQDAPARFDPGALAPSPLGWTSSWSSRAPPAFS
jgi:hypothetical protein